MTAPAISLESIELSLDGYPVFQDLNLEIPAGRWTCLLGQSGVGKTSLIKLIADLITPESGYINSSDGQALAHRVTYMAQQDLLLPWLSSLDNVLLGARLRRSQNKSDYSRAQHLLDIVGLSNRANDLPAKLSGGMRQRVALARTLFENKLVVLMDEPFSALDAITRHQLQELAAELLQDCTVILVTHDPMEALRLGHRIVLLKDQPAVTGKIFDLGGPTPRDLQDQLVINHQETVWRELSV